MNSLLPLFLNNNKKILIIDTETTGLFYMKGDRIIEIAIIELLNGKITKNIFHSYINPLHPISYRAYKIHNISNKQLIDKPTFKQIAWKLHSILNNGIVVAHNANFDKSFLLNEFKLLNIPISFTVIDTLKIARLLFPGKRNTLTSLKNKFSINIERKTHSAYTDALILSQIFLSLLTHYQTLTKNNKYLSQYLSNLPISK